MEEDDPYVGREQTLVKHFILRKYLSRFAPIVLSNWNSISYVDCFSGPWNAHTDDLRDTSFSIALEELRRARDHHADSRRQVGLRCFFLERDADAYARLKAYADAVDDAEVETRNAILEESVDAILDFVRRDGRQTFPFIWCFRHQLLLPRPYLVLTKPLRLDIQCQRGASVKIGWKYLDD